MGDMILCKGKIAKNPYHFNLTDTNIYSIEELCYYIYNNIYAITEAVFEPGLVLWLKNEINMDEIAAKLEGMIKNRNNLKDIVVSILCSADYYTENEIRKVIDTIDAIDGLPAGLKRKIKADNYLKYGFYSLALKEYEGIINSPDAKALTPGSYGDILHNMGIVRLHITGYGAAAKAFKEAYSKNGTKKSLVHYLMALKLDKKDEEFEYEVINYSVNNDLIKEINNKIIFACEEARLSDEYVDLEKMEHLKGDGKVAEFYKSLDSHLEQLKTEYKSTRMLVRE